jgi:single-stranded-DNA-specific exonuclease
LVERFGRPACVIAWDGGGQGTGSLRSVSGLDIGATVRQAVAAKILSKGGGHAMAAGITLSRDNLERLAQFFREKLTGSVRAVRAAAALLLDGALTPRSVTDELLALIDKAGPFGQGNPQPRFVFPAHRVKFAKIVGEAHLRCVLEAGDGSRLDAVAFRAAAQPVGEALLQSAGLPLHIAGHLRRDTWNGRNRRELVIEDVADPRQANYGAR